MILRWFAAFVAALFPFFSLTAEDSHTSVVIIGGGPSGLAAAIEASQAGVDVTIVEKRAAYSRQQWLFLVEESLQLLKKWEVTLPGMREADLGGGGKMGFVQIKHLEEGLAQRVDELGIKKIHGEFQGFVPHEKKLLITSEEEELSLPYDIVVGADGVHSRVRKALCISTTCMGSAMGISALIPCMQNNVEEMDISPAIKRDGLYIRKVTVPCASIIFTQGAKAISCDQLKKISEELGWAEEAALIGEGEALILQDIEISLQQACKFADEKKAAILLGEAAAAASFFQGMGANAALKGAELSGIFFKEVQTAPGPAYQKFNLSMKEITDTLINDNKFLFF